MQRLLQSSEKNSPEEYDKIYLARKEGGPDEFDVRRWKRLVRHYHGGKLLDMGCLDSLVPQIAHEKYPKDEIWGLDLAPETISDMQERFPFANFVVGDVYKTLFPQRSFDYVVAGELMEHLEDPQKFLQEVFRILKRGGTLALSVPKEEALEKGAVDGDRHLWSFSEDDMYEMLEPYGYVTVETLGSKFFPVYRYAWPSLIAYCRKT